MAHSIKKKLLTSPRVLVSSSILLFFVVIALFADHLAPYSADDMDISLRALTPNKDHWFGCDLSGADVFSAVILGSKTSLYVATATVILSTVLGTLLGLIAGFYRGMVDNIIMRFVDILMAFPGILLAMAIASLLGPSINNVIFAISATGWTGTSRLVRGQVLSLTEREYVLATRALGAKNNRLIAKHIFPGVISPLLVQITFSLSGVILVEASLSFLGLGAQEGDPSWGALLNQGRTALEEAFHLSLFPGLAIMIVVLALNFLGDALRDILDPKEVKN